MRAKVAKGGPNFSHTITMRTTLNAGQDGIKAGQTAREPHYAEQGDVRAPLTMLQFGKS